MLSSEGEDNDHFVNIKGAFDFFSEGDSLLVYWSIIAANDFLTESRR